MSTTQQRFGITDEVIGQQAIGNAGAIALGLLAYGKEHGNSPESVARWLGSKFAPGWEGFRDQPVIDVMRFLALNLLSVGIPLLDISGDEHRAVARFGQWPEDEWLQVFGLTRSETVNVFATTEPIAAFLGLDYTWTSEGDNATLTLERRSA